MSASIIILSIAVLMATVAIQAWLIQVIRKPAKRNYANTTVWEKIGCGIGVVVILSIQVGIIEDVLL